MYQQAMVVHPEVKDTVYTMLVNGSKDTEGMSGYNMSEDAKKSIVASFHEQYGEDAILAKDMQESASISHLGRATAIVPDTLNRLLAEFNVKTATQVLSEGKTSIKRRYSWDEMSMEQRTILKACGILLDKALTNLTEEKAKSMRVSFTSENLGSHFSSLNDLNIVEFNNESCEGLCENGHISISIKALSNFSRAMRVLIHELSHRIYPSTSVLHGRMAEEIWALVVNEITPKPDGI
jgi:quinol monooxygenase YgiN